MRSTNSATYGKNYGSIPLAAIEIDVGGTTEQERRGLGELSETGTLQFAPSRAALIFALVWILILIAGAVLLFEHHELPREAGAGSYSIRDCSFDECERSRCDSAHQQLCVAPVHDWLFRVNPEGCRSSAWPQSSCLDSCSLENCDNAHPAAKNTKASCRGLLCSQGRCTSSAYQCDETLGPFQCLQGAAKWACSSDQFEWPMAPNSTCERCCDISTC